MMNAAPVPAVLAVVLRNDHVLLVRRANPPDQGLWGFPGGQLERGETVAAGTLRELCEETGITATFAGVVDVIDSITGPSEAPEFHYVLIAGLCRWKAGEPLAADDALDAQWIPVSEIPDLRPGLSHGVVDLLVRAIALPQPR